MMQIIVNEPYERVMKDILEYVKEEKSSVDYYDPSKGIIIIQRSSWSWDNLVMRLVDVTPVPGGCLVRVHSFMGPSAIEWPGRMKAAEQRIIDMFKEREPTSEYQP